VPANYLGEQVAARYDRDSDGMFDPAVVERSSTSPPGSPATEPRELGIGTRRIAIPLAARGVRGHGIDLSEAMVRTFEQLSVLFRYVLPAELDLMARIARMTLRERWSGWKREPFTSESGKHVSVWQKPAWNG
jgi:hypothetical protein